MHRRGSLRTIALTRLAVVLALAAAALAVSNVFAVAPSVTIGSLSRGVGEQGQVSLRALGLGTPPLGAWTVDVTYNPAVISADSCFPQQNGLCNAAYAADKIRTNGVRIQGLSGDVTLANINFTCLAVGSSTLTVSLSVFADTTPGGPQPIAASTVNGTVTCTSEPTPQGLAGDVDCDHDVDAIDAALVLQYDAGLTASLPCLSNGDVNHDGRVNSIDGSIILQMAAGLL